MKFDVDIREYSLVSSFRITGHVFDSSRVIEVTLTDDNGIVGRGEANGAYYLNESAESMAAELAALAEQVSQVQSREELGNLMKPCGARNAVDNALWDLEAKQSGGTVWQIAGIEARPLTTVFTIGIADSASEMANTAAAAEDFPVLKIKVDGNEPVRRMRAIRSARPDAEIVVDANQGWTFQQLVEIAPEFADLNVAMIEQPLPRGADEILEGYKSPVVLCADESCLHLGEMDDASRRYQMINIKLDKSGGLTEGLAMAALAKERGLQLMIGNMIGSSLAMAPGTVIGQLCRFVDLDGPLILSRDREPSLSYENSTVHPTTPDIWG